MESKRIFKKKDLNRLAFRTVFLQSCFNYERMQGSGWALSLAPFLQKIYKDDPKGLSAAMKDNMEFMNTNTTTSGFLMGLILSLEEAKEERGLINSLKVALFGPLAGIGDAIFWFTILPIVAGVCSSFAEQGNILGPIIFFIVYVGIFISRIAWTRLGYTLGTSAIDKIKKSSKFLTKAATTLGVTVIGALIATYVKITCVLEIPVADGHAISIQKDFLDKILPNILPLGYTFLMYYFLRKKNVSPTILILSTFAFAILGSILGVI